MSKVYSKVEAVSYIDNASAWRKKDIAHMRSEVRKSIGTPIQDYNVRSGQLQLYAHLEGFTKDVCRFYWDYCTRSRHYIQSYAKNFQVAWFYRTLKSCETYETSELLFDKVTNLSHERITLRAPDAIETKSNLNSETLYNILLHLGIQDTSLPFDDQYLDVIILKRRNEIAHGNYLTVRHDDVLEASDKVIDFINLLSNILKDNIMKDQFLKP